MKPEPYLTKRGIEIFKRLENMLKLKTEEIDVFELSQLADAIALNQEVCEQINESGNFGVQTTANGYTAVNAYVTVKDKTRRVIENLSGKFGLTPADREKLKIKEEKKTRKFK